MEHKFGRLSRLLVMQLEERSQSGSLLVTGIELGGLADVLARPPQQESAPVVKRITAPEDIEILTPSALDSTIDASAAKEIRVTNTATLPHQRQISRPAAQHHGLGVARRATGGQIVLQSAADRIQPAAAAAGLDSAPMTTSADDFLAKYGTGWKVQSGCANGSNPGFIYGQQFVPSLVPNAPADQAPDQWEASARAVINENQRFFGFGSESLKLDAVTVLPLSQTGSSDKVAVTFKQFANGVPVFNGSASILFDATRKTVLALDTTGVPFADRVPTNVGPEVQQNAIVTAWAAYGNEFGVPATKLDSVQPMIVGPSAYFGENHVLNELGPTLAYEVKLSSPDVRDSQGLPIAATVFVSADLAVLKVESSIHTLSPISPRGGAVVDTGAEVNEFSNQDGGSRSVLDPIRGRVTGNVNTGQEPNSATNQETPPLANVWIRQNNASGTILATTNAGGRYRFMPASSPINLFVQLRGPYFQVFNEAGAEASFTVSATDGSNQNFLFNPTKGEFTTAEVAGAYWVNGFRNFVKGVNPSDTHMDFSVTTFVNISSSCNAYWDGSSINMFRAAGGCPNTAYATVIQHEEGHWANSVYNGSPTGAFHEGAADAWAYYISDTNCLAPEFFGPGQGCLRDGNQTSIMKCTSSPCNESCHGGGSHTEGQALASAIWKARVALKGALGQDAGSATANSLFLGWFQTYNDTAICNVIHDHWLVLDDDDGNLGNGTPHKTQIDAGFEGQGWPNI
jgi:hypothetical protein